MSHTRIIIGMDGIIIAQGIIIIITIHITIIIIVGDIIKMALVMNRVWSMPNSNTFEIKPINTFVLNYLTKGIWIDPFCGNSKYKKYCISNDLNPQIEADYHIDSLDFLKTFKDESVDGVLYDPPYSLRQISECYKGIGKKVSMEDTQSSFSSKRKREIARITKLGGIVLCFGWNSVGIGKTNGFEMVEILLVSHGGSHNDTICTAEIKYRNILQVLEGK
jgi:hypothetical protein